MCHFNAHLIRISESLSSNYIPKNYILHCDFGNAFSLDSVNAVIFPIRFRHGVAATLRLARALEGIDADGIEFDTTPWFFNCTNCTGAD